MKAQTEKRLRCQSLKARDALLRLSANWNDSEALFSLYDKHRESIEEAIFRWLGRSPSFNRAMCSVLVHIARSAHSFDPTALSAKEWILRAASREVRRLRCVIDSDLSQTGLSNQSATQRRVTPSPPHARS